MSSPDQFDGVRRILLMQQRQIGDALLATPALELLRRRFPLAKIHFFTEKKCEPLLRHNPHIDKFHLLDKKEQASFFSQIAWYRQVAAEHFDMVVDFQQLPRCRMLTRFCRAKWRLSFPSPWYRPWLYNLQSKPEGSYAVETKLSVLAPLGLRWKGERPRIYLTEAERLAAAALLEAQGLSAAHRLISVDPTHRRASKRWPRENFIRLLDTLADEDESLRFLLLRGPGEEEEVQALRRGLAHPERAFIPQPAPDLRLSAACMERAALHIGSCSSPRHMALALDVPSLVIPGASGPEWTYPEPYAQGRHRELRPALSCTPCSRINCPDPLCLNTLSPEAAATSARDMLKKYALPSPLI